MKLKKIATVIKVGGILFVKVLKMIRNPMDISPIFEIDVFLKHPSFKITIDVAKSHPEVKEMIDTRWLAPETIDLEELSQLPEGTLGHSMAKHMKHHKMETVFYPPIKNPKDDDVTYLRLRSRETHDIHHLVLGLKPHHLGEMAISSFYLQQFNSPLSAILMGTGLFVSIIKKPHMCSEVFEAMMYGWNLGKECKPILSFKWEEMWDRPLEEVRELMGIKVPLETWEQETQTSMENRRRDYYQSLSSNPLPVAKDTNSNSKLAPA